MAQISRRMRDHGLSLGRVLRKAKYSQVKPANIHPILESSDEFSECSVASGQTELQ